MTELTLILDRSGSMQSIASAAIGGFNAFIEAQRREPEPARFSLVLFDDRYEVPWKSVPLEEVPLLTEKTFIPRGSTALLDAIGRTLKKMTDSFALRQPANRPDKVIVAILTDGQENASRTYTQLHIADLIAARRAAGWEFVFLAANQDAIASATALNIPRDDAATFTSDSAGIDAVFQEMATRVSEKRTK